MLAEIRDAILQRQRFVITSHARPDGDAIGSQLAMAFALRALGKTVRVVDKDPAPPQFRPFPASKDIEVAAAVDRRASTPRIVMECGDLSRTGVDGLEKYFVINIDHHPGNTMYGAINWFDEGACRVRRDGVRRDRGAGRAADAGDRDAHLHRDPDRHRRLSFRPHHAAARSRSARRCTEAGAKPEAIARAVYDSSTLGRLRLMGAVLHNLELEAGGRLALAHMSLKMLADAARTHEDSDGLINLPLTVKEIEAVAFFKEIAPAVYRISLRSKGDVDVNRVAKAFGGGGHKNAAGCSMTGAYPTTCSNETARGAVSFPDGVLIIDKPAGPTSHDVVAVARAAMIDRASKKVGHTGTLDPLASGVLPLVLGRATRLAQFLSSARERVRGRGAAGRQHDDVRSRGRRSCERAGCAPPSRS